MKKVSLIVIILTVIIGSLGYLMVQGFMITRLSFSPPAERFPILTRFELPRDYGYFIGDEIPLTLVIATTGGVVLDLVNLPQKGEKHGVFEIRNRTITSTSEISNFKSELRKKVYRVAYTLQYFGPTPLTTHFPPLEILYALPKDKNAPTDTYIYQHLFTQPVSISISRLGPYHSARPAEIKGPLDDPRFGVIWTVFTLGTVCVLVSLGGWGREWWKKRQQRSATIPLSPTAADHVLHLLQDEEALFFPPVIKPPLSVGTRLDQILREYLEAEFGIPAFTLTTAELASHLNGVPLAQEILLLLERCAALKYAPPTASQTEERELWWETMALFEKLRKERLP